MNKRNQRMSRLQKTEYVGNDLHIQLRRIDNRIINTYYQAFENGEETVTIRFKNGDKLTVDVKGLLKAEIADKVIFALRQRREG